MLTDLDLAIENLGHEGLDGLCVDIAALGLVLDHVLTEGNVTVCWTLVHLHAEELQNTCVIILIDVDVNEKDLSKWRKKWG